ncbi:MAG: hypothetical protein HC933_10790 [Pleurocapsa sp. SU_196_0]|nr:hypothetical protein [Pleurocapsa sp. SU_196_0]
MATAPAKTAWVTFLERVRPELSTQRRGRYTLGSLRWLESMMLERGGNPAVVRNIIYRDVGLNKDKIVLRQILIEVATQLRVAHHLPEIPTSGVWTHETRPFLGREIGAWSKVSRTLQPTQPDSW